MVRAVIDTGTMITLSSTCLMNVFKTFVKTNHLELFISNTVAQESVWRPLTNKRFALNAARIKHAMNSGIITTIPVTPEILSLQQRILTLANNAFTTTHGPLSIIQGGEAEALALAKLYDAHALFIDERTTRALIENPARLKQVLERRQEQAVHVNEQNLTTLRALFPKLLMFRSVDLIATAYQQKLFDGELAHGTLELEAALYAAKYAGCAVSENEILDYLRTNPKA